MQFKSRSLDELGSLIVGDHKFFRYRSSYFITQLFEEAGLPHRHNGEWRPKWATEQIKDMIEKTPAAPNQLPPDFIALLQALMVIEDAQEDDPDRSKALEALNAPLKREGFTAFFDSNNDLYFKHLGTQTASVKPNPHRAFNPEEVARRSQLEAFLNKCSEDDLLHDVLLPLFRQLGFHRIVETGHEDKNIEHGKDMWMRYTLPTQHMLYIGLQAKKGKLDASADSTKLDGPNTGVAIVHHQVLMMLDSPVWDSELNIERLVDHAYIVAGGKITKSARLWIGRNLAPKQRSRIFFMDRDDILDLYVSSNTPLPAGAVPPPPPPPASPFDWDDEVPF